MKKKIKYCKYCKAELPKKAKVCPQCHKKQKMGLLPKAAIVIVALGIIGSMGNHDSSQDDTLEKESTVTETTIIEETTAAPEPESTSAPETETTPEETTTVAESIAETTTVAESIKETSQATKSTEEWAAVKALNLDNATIISIYKDYEKSWESSPEDPEKQESYEEQVDKEIGEKYGISAEDASQVYLYAVMNYDKLANSNNADLSNIKLKHGTLLSVTTSGSTIVLKAKITSNLTKKLTVQSCYFDVYDAVQKYNLNQYEELQYWAVADMSDGSEQKVISFTLPQDVLDKVAQDKIIKNQLANYATDIWISSALK